MNIVRVMVSAGSVYTYVDFAMGKNQPWLGSEYTNVLSEGGRDEWKTRFNINVSSIFLMALFFV
ncbi:hypothetical protein V6R21_31525 [Limibacter armeniacum]|uniref:hypothetical protein n=1 Tax=Limibacter armeniacum TaxID=466084 RepID=UPI002FE515EF